MMAQLRASLPTASPVPTRCCSRVARQSRAIQLRACQNIVAVGLISSTVDHFALFGKLSLLSQVVVVSVEVCNVFSDTNSLRIVPRAFANPVTGIHGCLTTGGGGAEVGTPSAVARSCGCGKTLAMPVGTGQASKVSSLPWPRTRDEKSHRVLCKQVCAENPRRHYSDH